VATPIFTNDGLKIRIDSEQIEPILEIVGAAFNLQDKVYKGVERWVDLPESSACVSAVCAFLVGWDWAEITATAQLAFAAAYFISCFHYCPVKLFGEASKSIAGSGIAGI
jgi:hypothetical protein